MEAANLFVNNAEFAGEGSGDFRGLVCMWNALRGKADC